MHELSLFYLSFVQLESLARTTIMLIHSLAAKINEPCVLSKVSAPESELNKEF